MGIPTINTPQDFCSYVDGFHHRRDVVRPYAFGIGAVRYNKSGDIVEAIFPKLNTGENFGSGAAFADVAHYRNGNAVYEPDFFDFKTLEELFAPFLDCLGAHPNMAASREVYRLSCSPNNMKPVIVFVGDVYGEPCKHPAYNIFMRQLLLFSATGDEKHLHYVAE